MRTTGKQGLIRLITTAVLLATVAASVLFQPPTSVTSLAASREPVRARHGIVASTNEVASKVGVDIMKRGGNAVDAAIAVAFALAVTHPAAGNLGGGRLIMFRFKGGRTTAIASPRVGPPAATPKIFLPKNRNVINGEGG